jgi:UDP-N-acetylmuramate dehydrogenase
MNLPVDVSSSLQHDVKLSHYCSMKVGGAARYFAAPVSEDELRGLIEFAKCENLPFVVMGKGSNILFPDEGFPGLVITLVCYETDRVEFDVDRVCVTASAGISLFRLVAACRGRGLGGLEFLANIPGTLGGALVMNAGFSRNPGQHQSIGVAVESAEILDNGFKRVLLREDLKFSYRSSNFGGTIVLSATLRGAPGDAQTMAEEIKANFEYRNQKQDLRYPSCGSVFKNPPPPYPPAARLIEQLGLKGMRMGGAMISDKHGNYVVNTGNATSTDIVRLICQTRETVFNATGVLLEPEVRIIERP